MLDEQRIEAIRMQSKAERWSLAKTCAELKKAGVESYTVWVPYHEITYHGGADRYIETHSDEPTAVAVIENLHVKKLQKAIARYTQKKSDYVEFLDAIAKAGVRTYRVDIAARTVTYVGKSGLEHRETIPSA